jgi:hypothetical protein
MRASVAYVPWRAHAGLAGRCRACMAMVASGHRTDLLACDARAQAQQQASGGHGRTGHRRKAKAPPLPFIPFHPYPDRSRRTTNANIYRTSPGGGWAGAQARAPSSSAEVRATRVAGSGVERDYPSRARPRACSATRSGACRSTPARRASLRPTSRVGCGTDAGACDREE